MELEKCQMEKYKKNLKMAGSEAHKWKWNSRIDLWSMHHIRTGRIHGWRLLSMSAMRQDHVLKVSETDNCSWTKRMDDENFC